MIAISDVYRVAPWADYLYSCDYHWWDFHYSEHNPNLHAFKAFAGERWTVDEGAAIKYGLHRLKGVDHAGLGQDCIHTGSNSAYQAINLAYLFGARRILLLGIDLQHGELGQQKRHFFGDHPPRFNVDQPFDLMQWAFANLRPELYGIEVTNCTRGGALEVFPRADLEVALRVPRGADPKPAGAGTPETAL